MEEDREGVKMLLLLCRAALAEFLCQPERQDVLLLLLLLGVVCCMPCGGRTCLKFDVCSLLSCQGRAEQSARSREQLGAVRTQALLELHLFSQIYMQDEKCSFQFRFFARVRLTN